MIVNWKTGADNCYRQRLDAKQTHGKMSHCPCVTIKGKNTHVVCPT